ncbi:hypothetical protein MMC14_007515 [Varicellaria rhodocarpa]|nr:hypothetical protein [Varicellaria rhodocarpa]
MSSALASSPVGLERRNTAVQALQSASPFLDFYTGSPSPSKRSQIVPHLHTEPHRYILAGAGPSTSGTAGSHAHPDLPIWLNPMGYGARHMNDKSPFSLWDESKQDFRDPTRSEWEWLLRTYDTAVIHLVFPNIIFEVATPPTPVPLTVASVSAIFIKEGDEIPKEFYGDAPYENYRLPDPCPTIRWPRWSDPRREQMVAIAEALSGLANIRALNFLPIKIIVELDYADGCKYDTESLPGVVAGVTTTYHHAELDIFANLKDHARERYLDPKPYLGTSHFSGVGPLPQDGHNYLLDPAWGVITPGMRVTTGELINVGGYATLIQSSTSGVRVRKGTKDRMTVSAHSFLYSNDVHHPDHYESDKLGVIMERYESLDVAMVLVNPSYASQITNSSYFKAEAPRRLVRADNLMQGALFEVEGMSTGLVMLQSQGKIMKKPPQPSGHPPTPFTRWRVRNVFRFSGTSNSELLGGLCGAPYVGIGSGDVAGFHHLGGGDWASCAAVDDLVEEGWDVV